MESKSSQIIGELQPSIVRSPQYVKLKAIEVDKLLGGGFRAGIVTELCGESGAGKSQMYLQLVLTCQLVPTHGGLYGNVVYIYTDYHFPIRRLKELIEGLSLKYGLHDNAMSMDNIQVTLAESCDMLCNKLEEVERLCETQLQTERHVRMLVVDSITSLFRSQFENNGSDMSRRSKYFTKLSMKLKQLAYQYNLVVVVTNGVSANFERSKDKQQQLDPWINQWHGPAKSRVGVVKLRNKSIILVKAWARECRQREEIMHNCLLTILVDGSLSIHNRENGGSMSHQNFNRHDVEGVGCL